MIIIGTPLFIFVCIIIIYFLTGDQDMVEGVLKFLIMSFFALGILMILMFLIITLGMN